MPLEFTTSYLADSLAVFRYYKKLAEGALAQISDDELFQQIDAESNSLAVIMRHMIGNMRSRWTDFLSTDGEKPWRNRDAEFLQPNLTRAGLMEEWEAAWQIVFSQLQPLSDADLTREITIRAERHSVMQAINRQVAHYSYHVGQIVFLAKHLRGTEWKNLSVPRNRSTEFNTLVSEGKASQR